MPLLSLCCTQSKKPFTLCFSVCKTGFPSLESPWQPSPMSASGLTQLIWTLVTRGMCGTASRVTTGEEGALLPFPSSHHLIYPQGCDFCFHGLSDLCLHRQSAVDQSIHGVLSCHGQLPLQVVAAHLPVCVCAYGWGLCHILEMLLFFHAGSCSPNFKFILFCHTLMLFVFPFPNTQESSAHFISLAGASEKHRSKNHGSGVLEIWSLTV